ncbi:hypothetical protein [uncultured Clostridium sp.]|nr:hypothetical protein [uncultured Clostridium sp.]
MKIELFQQLINELVGQGIKVQNLTLMQISKSIELYKLIHR